MSKYTEFRTDEDRIGMIVTGRMSNENLENKNLPSRMSVITKDHSERIEDITEWRKAIRSDKTNFVRLYSVWIPKVKKVLTVEENRLRINKLKELSYKFGGVNN